MNYKKYLGIKFSSSGDFPPNSGILEIFDDLEEGDEQEYYVEGSNDEWQFLISKEQIIETIFIYPENGGILIGGIKSNWSRKEVFSKLGVPESSGEESDSPLLGKSGAWDRYKMPNHYLHIEYNIQGNGIKVQTLMLPHVAS